MPTIYQIIIVALAAAFIILFSSKSGIRYSVRDFIDTEANRHTRIQHIKLIADMLDCDFCFSFWVSFVLAIVFAIAYKDASWIATPILSTPITRILL